MTLRCPICKKEIVWEGNPYRPFCSVHCKNVDLGRWLNEDYSIRHEASEAGGAAVSTNNPSKT